MKKKTEQALEILVKNFLTQPLDIKIKKNCHK